MTASKDKSVGLLWVTCLSLAVLALLAYVCTAPDARQMVKVPCEGAASDCVKNAQHQASADKAKAEYKAAKQISRLAETKARLFAKADLPSDASSARKLAKEKEAAAAKQLLKAKAAASRAEISMGKTSTPDDHATTVPSTVTESVVSGVSVIPGKQSTPLVTGFKKAVANVKKKAVAVFNGVSKGHSASDINDDIHNSIPNEPAVAPQATDDDDDTDDDDAKVTPMDQRLGRYQGKVQALKQSMQGLDNMVAQDTASTLKRQARLTALKAKVHRVASAQSKAQEDHSKAFARTKAKLTQEVTEEKLNRQSEEESSNELASSIAEGKALLEELHELKDYNESNEDDEDTHHDSDELYARDEEDTLDE